MTVKLLAEQNLEFLSLKGGCTGSSDYIHVKVPHCWKSHVATHVISFVYLVHAVRLPLVIEYDREIPQSHTADRSTAP